MSFFRPDLESLEPYTRPASELAATGKVRLHMNEAASGWPEPARKALLDRFASLDFHLYPERQDELTERVRLRMGAPAGGVLLGPSSGSLLDLVALAGLRPGDKVACPEPGFSLYAHLIVRHGGIRMPVSLGTTFPLDPWFQALGEGVRQLWMTLPNNPTGAWVSPEVLDPLLKAAAALPDPPLVILDEAYAEFASRTHRLLVDLYPNVLLLRTFSKALACAGWRLGCLVGDPFLIGKLGALQLPYSIPSPSLEALDVALDFALDFEEGIQATIRRRDQLGMALGSHSAPPSEANFLYVTPDPAEDAARAGLLVRNFPDASAARITVGDEEATRQTAKVLGGVLPLESGPRSRKRLLVLDVDGVMIDADRSFAEAVGLALGELAPQQPWDDSYFLGFKRVGGFNNDFRLAAGALALAERNAMDRLWKAEGVGFPDLEARIQELEPHCKEVVQRHYAVTKDLEKPLISLPELEALEVDVAIFTGRPPEELALAEHVLGFRLPAICDFAPHLRKPLPGGLLQLADAYRAQDVIFVGDTRDDAACLASARKLRPEIHWIFGGVGPDRDRIAGEGDLKAVSLRALLPLVKEAWT